MNIVFVAVLLILVFCAINGWRKGLLGMIYGLVSWVFLLVFVIWANPFIDNYLRERTSLPETMQQTVEQAISDKAAEVTENASEGAQDGMEEFLAELPEPFRGVLTDLLAQSGESASDGQMESQSQGQQSQEGQASDAQTPQDQTAQSIQGAVAQQLVDYAIRGIAILIAFVVAQLIVWLVGNIISAVGDAPVINGINGLLGFLAGAVQGFLYVWILMYLVALTGVTAFSQQIITYIYQNSFLVYLYQHNAVMAIVEIFL